MVNTVGHRIYNWHYSSIVENIFYDEVLDVLGDGYLDFPFMSKALEANSTDTTCLKVLTVFYMVDKITFYHLKINIYSKEWLWIYKMAQQL